MDLMVCDACRDGLDRPGGEIVESSHDRFFQAVAIRQIPRIRVAGIVVEDGKALVQQPADDPSSCYAFIGGEYEVGDTFETRLRQEFEEETNARVTEARYLFCVENHFHYRGQPVAIKDSATATKD